MKTRTPKGTQDYYFDYMEKRSYIENRIRRNFELWGFKEIRTPTFEYFDALSTGTGSELRESMFRFEDKSGRLLALRAEMTSPIARVVATQLRNHPLPIRLYYLANMFRYEEPQSGRQREFWHAGIELIGSGLPDADAEVIALFITSLNSIGLKGVSVKLGHVGLFKSIVKEAGISLNEAAAIRRSIDKNDEAGLEAALKEVDISSGIKDAFRLLPKLHGDLSVTDKLLDKVKNDEIEACIKNISDIINLLKQYNLDSMITVDLGIVRGIDYYTGAVFEGFVKDLGIAIGGGGRYDELVGQFGGESFPATGFAIGVDRCHLALEKQGFNFPLKKRPQILVLYTDRSLKGEAIKLSINLREYGMSTEIDVLERKLGKGLEQANKRGIPYVVIVGKTEIEQGEVVVRDMEKQIQEKVKISNLKKYFQGVTETS
ncbi:MAG: histidine--tRNA ligase [Candidatus Jordarchaeaceae archaeon]